MLGLVELLGWFVIFLSLLVGWSAFQTSGLMVAFISCMNIAGTGFGLVLLSRIGVAICVGAAAAQDTRNMMSDQIKSHD